MPDSPQNVSRPDAAASLADREAPPALENLRATVQRAATELERLREETHQLREENEQLRQRIDRLEKDPSAGRDGTALLVDDEPQDLRQQINQFIEAIDAHLNET